MLLQRNLLNTRGGYLGSYKYCKERFYKRLYTLYRGKNNVPKIIEMLEWLIVHPHDRYDFMRDYVDLLENNEAAHHPERLQALKEIIDKRDEERSFFTQTMPEGYAESILHTLNTALRPTSPFMSFSSQLSENH